MTLESLINQLEFDARVEQTILHYFSKNRSKIQEISISAYNEKDSSFLLCRRKPFTRLVVVLHLLVKQYDEYKAKKISDKIIFDTFKDVSLRSNLYLKRTGKIGITKDDVIWFRHIMNIKIFKIGSLQFQPFEMIYLDEEFLGAPYMSFSINQKKLLPNGTPVINCHIQKGANISADLVSKSIDQAKVFFKDYNPSIEYKAFLCYSWLLYPPMLQMLPDDSNIKQFAEYFSIIGECNDSEQAKENLFDSDKHNSPSKPTTLQRIAKEHKELLGYGCGVIML